MKKYIFFAFGVLVGGALIGITSFSVGFSIGKSEGRVIPIEGVSNISANQPETVDFSLFWEAWHTVQERFANADTLDYRQMVHGAIAGMIESLEDPYTVLMSAETTDQFLDDLSGFFEGVGMEIGIRRGQLMVIAPLEGTPAQKAGILPGDVILKIGEVSAADLTLDGAVSLIRGPKGTTVTLTILREDMDDSQEIVIERAVIEIPTMSWELQEGGVAYIKLNHFSEKVRRDFQRAAREIEAAGAQKIILDVRNNPGGFLEVAVDIAGWFVEGGSTVVIEDFGPGEDQKIHKATGNAAFSSWPTIVLINEGSASAAEIVAGALRDLQGIKLVGEKSFGKGSVQELVRLSDNSGLKITVANWLTPKGTVLNEKGLVPDIEAERSAEDIREDRDPQLDKALEIIRGL